MKIRVQQRDGSIAEIWLGGHTSSVNIWERTSDDVNELIITNNYMDPLNFIHCFDQKGYLLPEEYAKSNKDYHAGGVVNARIYIPPNKVKQ